MHELLHAVSLCCVHAFAITCPSPLSSLWCRLRKHTALGFFHGHTHIHLYIYIYIQIHTSVYSLCERDKHALFPCMYNETLRRWAFESTNTRHSHRRTQPHRPAPRQTGRVWFSGSFTTSHNHGMTPLPLSERKVRLVLLKRCFYRSRGLLPFGNVSVKGEDTNGIFSRRKNASLYPARMPHGPCSVVSLTPHENRKWPCVSII